jgi:RNA polymerase sigma factor (sigma-70 family)
MSERIRIEMRFKNAALFNALVARFPPYRNRRNQRILHGFNHAAEAIGVSYGTLLSFLNLSQCPWAANGELRPPAEKVMLYLEVPAEELFPIRLYESKIPKALARELDVSNHLTMLEAQKQHLLPRSTEEMDMPLDGKNLEECRSAIEDVLETLMPREQRMVRLRFGLEDGVEHSQEEIADQFAVCRGRVHQIMSKALRKLRHPARARKLRVFLGDATPDEIQASEEAVLPAPPPGQRLISCARCQTPFLPKGLEKYCSDDCRFPGRGPKVPWTCPRCQTVIMLSPATAAVRKYCTRACHDAARIETPRPSRKVWLNATQRETLQIIAVDGAKAVKYKTPKWTWYARKHPLIILRRQRGSGWDSEPTLETKITTFNPGTIAVLITRGLIKESTPRKYREGMMSSIRITQEGLALLESFRPIESGGFMIFDAIVLIADDQPDADHERFVATGLHFAEIVPVRVQFDPMRPVGRAALRLEGNEVHARVEIPDFLLKDLSGCWYPGVGGSIKRKTQQGDVTVIEECEIHEISLVPKANPDPRIKPLFDSKDLEFAPEGAPDKS